MIAKKNLHTVGNVLALIWMFGGMFFYFARILGAIYLQHKPAADAFLYGLVGSPPPF